MPTLSPSALVASAKCFCAYSEKQHLAAQAYAMAVKAGISTDPVTLARLARCTACIPEGEQDAVLAYLLSTVFGGSTSPSAIAVTGKCLSCVPPGYVEDVRTFLTAYVAGVTLNPTTLAYLSRGFMGMSKKQLRAIQIYAAQNMGGSTPPPTPPAAPLATVATAITQTQFQANWNASTGAVSYVLDVGTDQLFGAFLAGFNAKPIAGVTALVTGCTQGNPYFYRVRAVNASGTSANSNRIYLGTIANSAIGTFVTVDLRSISRRLQLRRNGSNAWTPGIVAAFSQRSDAWGADIGPTFTMFDADDGQQARPVAGLVNAGGVFFFEEP